MRGLISILLKSVGSGKEKIKLRQQLSYGERRTARPIKFDQNNSKGQRKLKIGL